MEVRIPGTLTCDQCGKEIPATIRLQLHPMGLRMLPPEDTTAFAFNGTHGVECYCSEACQLGASSKPKSTPVRTT